MYCTIIFNGNQVILFSDNEKNEILDLSNSSTLGYIFSKVINSCGAFVKFPINWNNAKKFCHFYNKICCYSNTNYLFAVDIFDLSDDEIKSNNDILKYIEDNTNCYFKYKYDTYASANLNEINAAIDFVEAQAAFVKKYNFSQLESLMFIYDMVRDREYVKELEFEGLDVSRNITKIITSSSIVCSGFANMFSAIANKVGIYTENIIWNNVDAFCHNHASNICYVNDSKYDIHGVFEFDATKGCRRKDNSYLMNYSFFANSFDATKNFNKDIGLLYNGDVNNLFYSLYEKYNNYLNSFDKSINLVSNYKALQILNGLIDYMSIIGMNIKECINLKNIIKDNNNMIDKTEIRVRLDNIINSNNIFDSIFNNNLEVSDFINILYNVRRVQHSIDKDKYLYSFDDLYNIYRKSFKSNDNKNLFGCFLEICILSYNYFDYDDIFKFIDDDALKMKLISVLRRVKKN